MDDNLNDFVITTGNSSYTINTNDVILSTIRHNYIEDRALRNKISAAFARLAIPLDEDVISKASNSEDPFAFVSGFEAAVNTIEKSFDDIEDRVARYRALMELE